jgi:hypothetical protein
MEGNMIRGLIVSIIAALACSATAVAQVQTVQIYSNGSASRPPQSRTGAISGTVVDENGAPVAQVMVLAIGEISPPNGIKIPISMGSRPTDEGGRFRIEGLPAQAFLVAVMPPPPRPFIRPGAATAPIDQPIYGVTYYPGVASRAQAQTVSVAAEGEQAIFIELVRQQPFHVRGTVSGSSGRSPAGLQIMLQQTVGSSSSTRSVGFVQQDGTFDVGNIVPGSYGLQVRVSMDPDAEFAARDIEVVDRDLDVALTLGRGGSINGRIVLQGPAIGPAPLGASVGVSPLPGKSFLGRQLGPVGVSEDWTFQIRGLYGTYRFGMPMASLGQYRLVRYEFDGRDIGMADAGVSVHDGEHELVMYFAPVVPR